MSGYFFKVTNQRGWYLSCLMVYASLPNLLSRYLIIFSLSSLVWAQAPRKMVVATRRINIVIFISFVFIVLVFSCLLYHILSIHCYIFLLFSISSLVIPVSSFTHSPTISESTESQIYSFSPSAYLQEKYGLLVAA